MKLPNKAVTPNEFQKMINSFLSNECEKSDGHLIHKNCGGAIRVGFANLFYENADGSLDPGPDGFGIGPKRVPYCENCDPPDGHGYKYARRVPIRRNPATRRRNNEKEG